MAADWVQAVRSSVTRYGPRRRLGPLARRVRRSELLVEVAVDVDVTPCVRGQRLTRLSAQEKDTVLFYLADVAPDEFDEAFAMVMDLRAQVAAEQSLEAVSS